MSLFKTPRAEAMAQYILFAVLVVLTPFIVVTRYLQGVIHIVSHLNFPFFGIEIPLVLIVAVAGLVALALWQYRNLTRRKVMGLLVIAALVFLAHQTMDMYLDLSFFDLQQNWHYLAYGTYAFFFFRAFNVRNMPKNKMIIFTYLSAVAMSVFDETFQYFLSSRVFDISDITKDALGVYCGLILVLFVTETYGSIDLKSSSFTKRRLSDYLRDPLSAFLVLGALTLAFVLVSPLLAEHENWHYCLLCGFGLFLIIMLVIHLSQYKLYRIIFISLFLLLILLLAVSFGFNYDHNVTYSAFALTVYKGLPVPFFDLIIYPDGRFHLVDKKHRFNEKDRNYFFKQKADILLVGSGWRGRGGKGFDVDTGTYFMFNTANLKGIQIIILPTPEATRKFNQLKEAGKSVLFVVHSTC